MWSHRNVTDRHVGRGRWSGQSVTIVVNMSVVISDVGGKKMERDGSEEGRQRKGGLTIAVVTALDTLEVGSQAAHAHTQAHKNQARGSRVQGRHDQSIVHTAGVNLRIKGPDPPLHHQCLPSHLLLHDYPFNPPLPPPVCIYFLRNLRTSFLSLMGIYKMLSVRTRNHLHWNKQQLSYFRMWSHLERIKLSEWLLKTNPRCKIESKSERLAWRETLKTKRLSGPGLTLNFRIWNVFHMSTWERANRSP